MARGKALTYEEFIALAKENYTKGGDVAVECWERYQFDEYVKMFGVGLNFVFRVQAVFQRRGIEIDGLSLTGGIGGKLF